MKIYLFVLLTYFLSYIHHIKKILQYIFQKIILNNLLSKQDLFLGKLLRRANGSLQVDNEMKDNPVRSTISKSGCERSFVLFLEIHKKQNFLFDLTPFWMRLSFPHHSPHDCIVEQLELNSNTQTVEYNLDSCILHTHIYQYHIT